MNKELDLVMIEHKLMWLYNATEVDIDVEGIFASFIWDEYDPQKYQVIAEYLWSQGLYDVGYQELGEDSEIVIYGFFDMLEEDEMTNEQLLELFTEDDDIEVITERKTVVKVNAKGKRRRKVVCGKGKKWDGKRCVAMSGKQKLNIRKGKIKARRTNKTKGSGKKRRTAMLRKKALKKRGQQGLGKK